MDLNKAREEIVDCLCFDANLSYEEAETLATLILRRINYKEVAEAAERDSWNIPPPPRGDM